MSFWWQNAVIYQIYPRSFMDASGDGVGDLQGILNRLDYLNDGTPHSLGVDAIWISPFYPSPMADFGYDVADYVNIDPLFGDLATMDELIRRAHERGIKIIIDYVPNHTSNQHPWFIEARQSRTSPKRDWYIWRDGQADGRLPNNWGSYFGGPAWTWDEATQQYYLHQFAPNQPELNWRNPEVQQAMLDVLHFWLQRGVDGFRMDVVGHVMKHPDLPDNPPNPTADPATMHPDDLLGRQLSQYNMNQPEAHELFRTLRQLVDGYGERVIIGEVFADFEVLASYYGRQQDGLHLPFNFHLIWTPFTAPAIRQLVEAYEAALPAGAWPNYVLGNHDQPRLASKCGPHATRLAAMLLLTLRGTPTLYYGDELGLANGRIPPEKIQDPQGVNLGAERSRDPYRTPMQWDDSPHAGFSAVEPWLPVADDYATNNIALHSRDGASLLALYQRLIWFRKQSAALTQGAYATHPASNGHVYAFTRTAEDEQVLVLLNFGGAPQTVAVSGQMLLSTGLDREGETAVDALHLRPYEGVVVRPLA